MNKEFELWHFIAARLKKNQSVMLLVVAESSGSSPGRQGYKMAVGSDGELCGSIGGGVMEVNLVEQSQAMLSEPPAAAAGLKSSPPYEGGVAESRGGSFLVPQIHQKNSPNSSGMICSGKQTVIFGLLTPQDSETVGAIVKALTIRGLTFLKITPEELSAASPKGGTPNTPPKKKIPNENFRFEKRSNGQFIYTEKLGHKNNLYIVGGGHCALALSELMSRMDFHISLFDDRPELNTIDKNRFAHHIEIIDNYERIGDLIHSGANTYVVVMTLGYKSDESVIRKLLDRDFKYFGVLGSKAKMKTLLNALKKDGCPAEKLAQIHTPIGLPIHSRTPEEIAISIAAEIISVKNAINL